MNSFGNRPGAAVIATSTPEEDQRRALIQRIVASQHFAKAHQLRDILLYLAERALTDSPAAVHEYEIACVVLGRKADFNPHEDNIVRVQVSHVRKRLDDYFSAEGAPESIRVSIPKGGYTLLFAPRPIAAVQPASHARRFPYGWVAVVLGASIIIAALTFYTRLYWASRNPTPQANDLLWPRVFAGQGASIVVADTCLVMLQDILQTDLSLSDYLNGRFPRNLIDQVPDQSLQDALRLISTRLKELL